MLLKKTVTGLILVSAISVLVVPVYGCDGQIGALMIDDKMYYEVNIKPEFRFGQLKVGIDLPVRWNDTDGIRKEDWDGKEDISNILRYIEWADKGAKPLYFRIGSIDGVTFGNGFIVENYFNIPQEKLSSKQREKPVPYKRCLGSLIDVNFTTGGIETLVNNIINPRLYGIRCYVKPLIDYPLVRNTEFGFTYVADTGAGKYEDKELKVYGVDVSLPVVKDYIVMYGDYADIKDAGVGLEYGVKGCFGTRLFRCDWHIGRRSMDANFIPNIISSSYEVIKPTTSGNVGNVDTSEKIRTVCGDVDVKVMEVVSLRLCYEDPDNQAARCQGKLWVDQDVLYAITNNRVAVNIFYDHRNVSLSKKDLTITAEIRYGISEHVELIYTLKKYYDKEGKIYKTSNLSTGVMF
jgi:hypothetical protein